MDFKKVVEERRSVRKFKPDTIPVKDITEIIRIGTLAPSAHNNQDWFFKAVYNKEVNNRSSKAVLEKIDAIVEECKIANELIQGWKWYSSFFNNAPVVIYAFYSSSQGFMEKLVGDKIDSHEVAKLSAHPNIQSIGGAIQNILLAATNMGYGACWMTAPNIAAREIEKLLKASEGFKLAAIIPIAVPLDTPRPRPRKPLDEVMEIVE